MSDGACPGRCVVTALVLLAAILGLTVVGLVLIIAATAGDRRAASTVDLLRAGTPAHRYANWDGTEGRWP